LTTAIDKLQGIFPPCYRCGTPFIADSEAEAVQYIKDNEFYLSTLLPNNPDKQRVQVRLGYQWLCPTCLFQRDKLDMEAERRWRHDRLIEITFGYGKMPKAAIVHNFTQSTADIESINPEAWTLARSWDNDFSLWVQGTKGVGKTFLSRCVLNKALDMNVAVYEANAIDFCEWVYRQGEKPRHQAEHIDVLMLDDIDKPEWRVDSLIALLHLLDIRHRDKLITIITANVSPEVMRTRWKQVEGPERSIVDPMIDRMRGFKRITLTGGSLR
jgi:DNA replication protein DnaC